MPVGRAEIGKNLLRSKELKTGLESKKTTLLLWRLAVWLEVKIDFPELRHGDGNKAQRYRQHLSVYRSHTLLKGKSQSLLWTVCEWVWLKLQRSSTSDEVNLVLILMNWHRRGIPFIVGKYYCVIIHCSITYNHWHAIKWAIWRSKKQWTVIKRCR